MKCPVCGHEMESGFIRSQYPIVWTEKKHDWVVKKWVQDADILSERPGILMKAANLEGMRCRECRIVVGRY